MNLFLSFVMDRFIFKVAKVEVEHRVKFSNNFAV